MSRMPRTSVALCTCNGAQWLAAQLESILNQSVPVEEIILSDDASEDGTVALAQGILGKSGISFLIVEATTRQGFIANFEKAVRHCRGTWIFFCDQDDLWEVDKVEQFLHPLQSGAVWAFSDASLIDAQGVSSGASLWSTLGFSPKGMDSGTFAARLLCRPVVTGATMAVQRAHLDACLPFHPTIPHDQWISLFLSLSGFAPAILPQPLTRYRIHGSQQIGIRGTGWKTQASQGLATVTQGYLLEVERCLLLKERLNNHSLPSPHITLLEEKIRHMLFRAGLGGQPFLKRTRQVLTELASGRYRYSWTPLAAFKDIFKARSAST
jgi:hypothetical protein